MEYLILIPIFIVIIYGMFLLNNNKKLNFIVIGVTIFVITMIVYFVLQDYLTISENLVTLLVIDILIYFCLLRLDNKITLIFLFLFLVSIGLLLLISYKYEDTSIYISFLLMMVFLLAENNQIFIKKSYEEALKIHSFCISSSICNSVCCSNTLRNGRIWLRNALLS